MGSLTTLMFLFTASLGIVTLATMGYVFSGRSPEMRFTLVVSLLVVFALLALAPLLSITNDPKRCRARLGEKWSDSPLILSTRFSS